MSVRFLSALGSGDVVCIISGQDIILYQELRALMAKDWLALITSPNFNPDQILFDTTNRKIKIVRRGEGVNSKSHNNESTQFSLKTDR